MMSKKQWFVLLCLLIIYLLLGAVFFHEMEKVEETKRRKEERAEKVEIEKLLLRHYNPGPHGRTSDLFEKLSKYCGKTVSINMSELDEPLKWDFYHSLFFVITVVSTIGYGNLAPTTMLTRIFMIFYGVIGIPINGIVMVTLGEFFGKKFIKVYRRWKSAKMEYDTARLGLIGQIILYLVPGFTLLIFLPSVLIMIFERWSYHQSVYYAFVTLTTIGFGDIVAGVTDNGLGPILFSMYKVFLLVWIIIGLGYVVMVMGFISRGLRSKQMHHLEHVLANNIKKTPQRLREEFRSLLHELLLTKVKRVYKDKFTYTPRKIERSVSCPDLTLYRNQSSPTFKRKRAFSESIHHHLYLNQRIQSDTELDKIDKERTFEPAKAIMKQSDLFMMVVEALGKCAEPTDTDGGVNCFTDEEILASETIAATNKCYRKRAFSEVQFPFSKDIDNSNLTWYGPSATKKIIEIREKAAKSRSCTSVSQPSPGLMTRIRNTFKTSSKENVKNVDVERQEFPKEYVETTKRGRTSLHVENMQRQARNRKYSAPESVLENTSVAEFFRALTEISAAPTEAKNLPKRKLGVASLTPPAQISPPRSRRLPIRPLYQPRRSSLMPPQTPVSRNRRYSLRPAQENQAMDCLALPPRPAPRTMPSTPTLNETSEEFTTLAPPPYTGRSSIRAPGSNRRYSLRPVVNISSTPSPVQRQIMKTKDKDEQGS